MNSANVDAASRGSAPSIARKAKRVSFQPIAAPKAKPRTAAPGRGRRRRLARRPRPPGRESRQRSPTVRAASATASGQCDRPGGPAQVAAGAQGPDVSAGPSPSRP